MMNTNDNTEGIEVVEAPPVMYGEDDADSIEQLPNANDDVVLMNNLPNSRHASKKYIISAIFVGIAGFAAFFGVGMGSGYGIENAVNKSANEASSVSSVSMAFTDPSSCFVEYADCTNNESNCCKGYTCTQVDMAGDKRCLSACTKVAKSSKSKSGKSVTTTSTTTAGTTTAVSVICI